MDYPVNFCPLCGSDKISTFIDDDEHIKARCLKCHFTTMIEMRPFKPHEIRLVAFEGADS